MLQADLQLGWMLQKPSLKSNKKTSILNPSSENEEGFFISEESTPRRRLNEKKYFFEGRFYARGKHMFYSWNRRQQ